MQRRFIRAGVILLTIAALSALDGLAVAAASTTPTEVMACVDRSGSLSLLSPSGHDCHTHSKLVRLSLQGGRGQAGPQGVPGAVGATGLAGPAGADGADGAAGAASGGGDENYHTTIVAPGASSGDPATVTLLTDGPFTLVGECYATEGSTFEAQTALETSQPGSAFQDYYSREEGSDVMTANSLATIGDDRACKPVLRLRSPVLIRRGPGARAAGTPPYRAFTTRRVLGRFGCFASTRAPVVCSAS